MPKVSIKTVTLFFYFSPYLFSVDMPHISIYHHRTTLPNIALGKVSDLTHVPLFSTLNKFWENRYITLLCRWWHAGFICFIT
jgi:hypothetical protein